MSLDLHETAAQLIDVTAKYRLDESSRKRSLELTLSALQSTDARTLNDRAESSQGQVFFLPAEAIEHQSLSYPNPGPPPDFSIFTTDGSHIDVDRHSPLECYLINIGSCHLTYGAHPFSQFTSTPRLYTTDKELFIVDPSDQTNTYPVEGVVLGLVRAIEEIKALVQALKTHDAGHPVLGLLDGTLILWALGGGAPPGGRYPDYVRNYLLDRGFLEALFDIYQFAQEHRVAIASYISLPNSSEVANLIRLALCDYDPIGNCSRFCSSIPAGQRHCDAANEITDRDLFGQLLQPGSRSALYSSRSPVVRDYYAIHKTHFFYLNVGNEIARIEIPGWIASDPEAVDLVHSVVLDNALRGDGYPVALQEAHEQAVITSNDRNIFSQLIDRTLENQSLPVYTSEKQRSKRNRWV